MSSGPLFNCTEIVPSSENEEITVSYGFCSHENQIEQVCKLAGQVTLHFSTVLPGDVSWEVPVLILV